MLKDKLKSTQPIVYNMLINALEQKRLAHAILLHGLDEQLLDDTATFIAQSLLCDHDVACEFCLMCEKVKEHSYADMLYYDCSDSSLKKEEVVDLQEQFMKTPLEEKGIKIYIIKQVENASVAALNTLLKFLEEPTDNTYAILISKNIYHVLPTIVSRCECLKFNVTSKSVLYDAFKGSMDSLNAYFVSYLHGNINMPEEEEYQIACEALKSFVNNFEKRMDEFLVHYELEILTNDKVKDIKVMRYFMDLLGLFFKDLAVCRLDADNWYTKAVRGFSNYPKATKMYLETILQKDKINNVNNLLLVMEELIYHLMEVKDE